MSEWASSSRLWPSLLAYRRATLSTIASAVLWTHGAWASEPPAANHSPTKAPAAATAESSPDVAAPSLVTRDFEPRDEGFTLHYQLLKLPELATRLVLTPLFPLLAFAEETRLDRRVEDLITNDDHTRVVLPVLVALTRDGVGAGLLYHHDSLRGAGEALHLFGLIKGNQDRSLEASYSEMLPWLDGRRLGLTLHNEVDHNERYYGLGPDTSEDDQRALEVRTLGAKLELDLGGPNTYFRTGFGSTLTIGVNRQWLDPGTEPGVQPLGDPADSVAPPPAFDQRVDYGRAHLGFSYDQRDITGRTHRGFLIELSLEALNDLDGQQLNAGKASLGSSYFLPLAPRHRVLVMHAGVAAATPLGEAATVPLDGLVSLGRSSGLRGYTNRRFRDRSGWWGSLEYRYPIFDFEDTGGGLSAATFVDLGNVAGEPEDFFKRGIHYAPGLGLRAEVPGVFVVTGHIAMSPDGLEASLSVNEHYELKN